MLFIWFCFEVQVGRVNDGRVWKSVATEVFAQMPWGTFLVADAGFPLMYMRVLTPYRGVQYYLKQWAASASLRPSSAKEIFNLKHAQLQNPIEKVFGIWKRKFGIINSPPELREVGEWVDSLLGMGVLLNIMHDCDGDAVEKELEVNPLSGDVISALEAIAFGYGNDVISGILTSFPSSEFEIVEDCETNSYKANVWHDGIADKL